MKIKIKLISLKKIVFPLTVTAVIMNCPGSRVNPGLQQETKKYFLELFLKLFIFYLFFQVIFILFFWKQVPPLSSNFKMCLIQIMAGKNFDIKISRNDKKIREFPIPANKHTDFTDLLLQQIGINVIWMETFYSTLNRIWGRTTLYQTFFDIWFFRQKQTTWSIYWKIYKIFIHITLRLCSALTSTSSSQQIRRMNICIANGWQGHEHTQGQQLWGNL